MIKSFKSKAWKVYWTKNDGQLLPGRYLSRIRHILRRLEYAEHIPADLSESFWHIHQLKGSLKGYWSVTVSANYRIVFRFESGHAYDVDYLDYH